jgi:hypothetical protein
MRGTIVTKTHLLNKEEIEVVTVVMDHKTEERMNHKKETLKEGKLIQQ